MAYQREMKKYYLLQAGFIASVLSANPAIAGETPETVVELFTSQGCSSCPPANEFVGELSADNDKLVLSYGVTYWDFLGWKDTFGDPEFTKRQKKYGRSLGIGPVYTPQIVLNGREHNSRYRREDVESSELLPLETISLDLSAKDGFLSVDTNAEKVLIVCYTPGWQEIDVKRGENGGLTLRLANVVDNIEIIKSSGQTDIKIDSKYDYAALVHDRYSHQIIAASILRN